MPTPEPSMLDAALLYAKQGWQVFPVFGRTDAGGCACGSDQCSQCKHPRTPKGVLDATTNEAVIRTWWANHPTDNIGIRTGPESGLCVLDYDGLEGLELAGKVNGLLTPRATTGRGEHHYYAYPAFDVTNRAHVLPGMDVRSTNGYVIAPPSVHVTGTVYRWASGFSPEDTAPAPLPDEIVKLLQGGANPVIDAEIVFTGDPLKDASPEMFERAKAYALKVPGAVSGAGGHDDTFVLALKLIHGFWLSDKQAGVLMQEYNTRCKPPWSKSELAHKIKSARESAKDPAGIATLINPNAGQTPWLATLQMTHTKNGPVPEAIEDNARIYIVNDEPPSGRPRLDAFSGKLMVGNGDSLRGWTDHDLDETLVWLQDPSRKLRLGRNGVQTAVNIVAHRNEYHPVRDYLASLEWDGNERIGTWLIRHGHAKDDKFVRAVSAKWLISAVARVFKPGCRADCVLILEGAQGTRKSTTVEVLGKPWSAGLSNTALHTKDAMEQLAGKWIIELSELDSMTRSEVSAVKDFLSRTNDYFRESYARNAVDHRRQCVFIGSSNEAEYLKDPTGGRRFWPVTVHGIIDTDGIAAERDQLFAEAVAKFYAGVPWHLDDAEEGLAKEEQKARTIGDSWEQNIAPWLAGKIIESGPLLAAETSVSVSEVLSEALQIDVAHHTKPDQMRVASILRGLGWKKERHSFQGARQYRFVAPASNKVE